MNELFILNGLHLKSYNKFIADALCDNDAAIVYQYMFDTIHQKKWSLEEVAEFSIVDLCEECNIIENDLEAIFFSLLQEDLIKGYEISNFAGLAFCKLDLKGLEKLMSEE